MKIVVSPLIKPVPVLQIDPHFKWCTDEYRAKHNAWLLERFGTKEVAFVLNGDTIAVSPQHAAMLRAEAKKGMYAPAL
ncbi:MAG: hypothetical protein ABFC67_14685 [Mizugakiibacter sp.]|uniref:hypothetical protein n=1 Tax=Mizugakiibacter sp. TaxID=1972610 RepID=UPI00320E1B88